MGVIILGLTTKHHIMVQVQVHFNITKAGLIAAWLTIVKTTN